MHNLDCVYFFPKQELTKENKTIKYIFKLIEKNKYVNNEINIINELTNYKNFFYIPESTNKVQEAEMTDNMQNLKSLIKIKEDNYYLFKYEKLKLVYLKYYLKSLNSSKIYIYNLLSIYKYLLTSIQILINHNIVHNNINLENILIDEFNNPLLVKFQYALYKCNDINKFKQDYNFEYTPSNINICPELQIVSYMSTNKLTSLSYHNIEIIINNLIEHNSLIHNFGQNVVNNLKKNGITYFEKYVNKSYEYIIEDILQYRHTWDNYALSLVFLKIYIDIHKTIKVSNKFIIFFMKLLLENISIEPTSRLSIEDTTNKFQKILYNVDENNLQNLINYL
jgi:serine/threonine protein kinase